MKMKKLFLMILVITAMTACTNDDNITSENQNPQNTEARTYSVNIAASIGGDEAQTRAVTFDNSATPPTATGRFETTEPIYVYNQTKGAMLSGTLHPSDISSDGKHCQLTGTLTGTVDAGDKLTLAYNMNYYDAGDILYCFFDYNQDGTAERVLDGGLAKGLTAVSLSEGVLTTLETASFQMQQAIFRLKFTDGTNPITVKTLVVQTTTNPHIATYYLPFVTGDSRYTGNSITVSPASPTSDYLYVAICIKDIGSPSALQFTATDNAGNQYKASKSAPTGGFQNGSYYYNSAPIALAKQTLVEPTVAWTSVKDGLAVQPDQYNKYGVYGPWNGSSYSPAEISISGTSLGYRFYMYNGATIHLNGLTATYDGNDFIYSTRDLNLDISGTNIITCKNENQAIFADGTLKLCGNGTLTVTATSTSRYGLLGSSNYNSNGTSPNNSNASNLAADGYTVTRSAMTNNGDGSYTWTYTVAPTP